MERLQESAPPEFTVPDTYERAEQIFLMWTAQMDATEVNQVVQEMLKALRERSETAAYDEANRQLREHARRAGWWMKIAGACATVLMALVPVTVSVIVSAQEMKDRVKSLEERVIALQHDSAEQQSYLRERIDRLSEQRQK